MLAIGLAKLLVAAGEDDLSNPRGKEGGNRERGRGRQSDNIAGSIRFRPQVGGPDE